MLAQFDNQVLSSFYLWFENKLLGSDVKAYTVDNDNSFSYVGAADSAGNWLSYQGRFRQLVAEEEVTKVNSGVFINGSFTSGNSSNIYIDYNDGRIIVPVASGTGLTISANSTVKEVNVYLTNDKPEEIFLHNDFVVQGSTDTPYFTSSESRRDEKNVFFVPACFLSIESSDNKEFCFGGEEETRVYIRAFVVADNIYNLDAILSLFRDTTREDIRLISNNEFPYGAFFSLKSFPYNYDNLVASQPKVPSTRAYIEKVRSSKITREVSDNIDKQFLLGLIDFDLVTPRFPRA